MTAGTHRNSQAAFHGLDLNKREALVLSAYLLSSVPLTDRDCAERLGFSDMNATRPRITGLVDRGLLYEVTDVVCAVTKRKVRCCAPTSLARPEPRQLVLDDVLA